MNVFALLLEALAAEGAGALVSVVESDGSAPRDAGTRMVVRPSGGFNGTIGGGALEWEVLNEARAALAQGRSPARTRLHHLGPDLGQCCGGRVAITIETFDGNDAAELTTLARAVAAGPVTIGARVDAEGRVRREIAPADLHRNPAAPGLRLEHYGEAITPLLLFGAGHVARALILALAPLPFHTRWIDERPDAFPSVMPANVDPVRTSDGVGEITRAPAGAFVLVMTHSHALDFDLVSAALAAGRFPYLGLIGSATKRVRFERRLSALGLSHEAITRMICPIGIAGISGKEPAVIAAATVAQLLMRRDQRAESTSSK
jgi:xanthine dehydrogenase accessory factor